MLVLRNDVMPLQTLVKTGVNVKPRMLPLLSALLLCSSAYTSLAFAQNSQFIPAASLPQDRAAVNDFPQGSLANIAQGDELLAGSGQRLISEIEVYQVATAQGAIGSVPQVLRLMRAEIRARKGQRFSDADLQAYFNTRAWYQPRFDTVSLSTVETRNSATIQSVEAKIAQGGPLTLSDLSQELLSPLATSAQAGVSPPQIAQLGLVNATSQELAPIAANVGNDQALQAEQAALEQRIAQSSQVISFSQAPLPDLSGEVRFDETNLPQEQQSLVMVPRAVTQQQPLSVADPAVGAMPQATFAQMLRTTDPLLPSTQNAPQSDAVFDFDDAASPQALTAQDNGQALPAIPELPVVPAQGDQETAQEPLKQQELIVLDAGQSYVLRPLDPRNSDSDKALSLSERDKAELDMRRFKAGDRIAILRMANDQLVARPVIQTAPRLRAPLVLTTRAMPSGAIPTGAMPARTTAQNPVIMRAPFMPTGQRPAPIFVGPRTTPAIALPRYLPPYPIAMPVISRQVVAETPAAQIELPTPKVQSVTPSVSADNTAAAQPSATQNNRFILPFAQTRVLEEKEIIARATALSELGNVPAVLRLARNEIAARRGRVFKSEVLNNYFLRQPWYQPNVDLGAYTRIEQQNMDRILKLEQAYPGQRIYRNLPKAPIVTRTATPTTQKAKTLDAPKTEAQKPQTDKAQTQAVVPEVLPKPAPTKPAQIKPAQVKSDQAQSGQFLLPQSAYELLDGNRVLNTIAYYQRQQDKNLGKPWQIARLMRAEIYARSGFEFQQPDLKAYFSKQAWYRPIKSPFNLTELEQQNFSLLLRIEQDLWQREQRQAALPLPPQLPSQLALR